MKQENLKLDIRPLKKVIVFIDGNNLFHRMQEFYHTHQIDIYELSKILCCQNRQLLQIRYYYSPFVRRINEKTANWQQTYVTQIEKISNIFIHEGKYIRKKTLLKKETFDKIRNVVTPEDLTGYVEKGIDTKIAVDMISMGIDKKYDTAILVSSDSDFVPVINELKNRKVAAQVAAFQDGNYTCYDLKNACLKSFLNLHYYIPVVLKKQKAA